MPKLNRGLRAQVIVKKMPLPQKQDSAAEEHSEEEEVDEAQLVTKRREYLVGLIVTQYSY